MRWIVRLVFALTALLLGAFAWLGIPATAAGLVAKNVCSGVFVARRAQADVLAADVLPASPLLRLVHVSVDEGRQLVRGGCYGPPSARRCGCPAWAACWIRRPRC